MNSLKECTDLIGYLLILLIGQMANSAIARNIDSKLPSQSLGEQYKLNITSDLQTLCLANEVSNDFYALDLKKLKLDSRAQKYLLSANLGTGLMAPLVGTYLAGIYHQNTMLELGKKVNKQLNKLKSESPVKFYRDIINSLADGSIKLNVHSFVAMDQDMKKLAESLKSVDKLGDLTSENRDFLSLIIYLGNLDDIGTEASLSKVLESKLVEPAGQQFLKKKIRKAYWKSPRALGGLMLIAGVGIMGLISVRQLSLHMAQKTLIQEIRSSFSSEKIEALRQKHQKPFIKECW